jgi:glycosyltransferase involved in cell wall biosynthesis
MGNELVSVVVPTYNRAYCIRRTIDSALGQTYRGVEVIVVDDGSTDDTGALIAGTYGGDSRVRYVYKPNGGVSSARNRGFKEARGEYIALLDSDDVWKPWKLQVQVACLRHAPEVGMVWTDMEAIDADGAIFSANYLRTKYSAYRWFRNEDLFHKSVSLDSLLPGEPGIPAGMTFYAGDVFSQMIMGSLVHTSTVLLRRERVERVKGFIEDWRLGEDYEFHLRTCREGDVGFVDAPSIQYQRGLPDHISHDGHLLATKFLQTVTETIERDRERIKLPGWMLDEVRAEAHHWVGDLEGRRGNAAAARRHFARSLSYRAWQPRTLAMLCENCMPGGVRRGFRAACGALARNGRRVAEGRRRVHERAGDDRAAGAARG